MPLLQSATAAGASRRYRGRPLFPFCAIVGQSQLRLALTLIAIQPTLGGVLIRGEKGTAKSTVVRSLAALLPRGEIRTLALNATEDRLLGGLDLEATLSSGSPVFQPGLLSSCDQGICYIDEVNLLAIHLVNIVLDAAASGVVIVEREGFSTVQATDFSLVGTMNPEEGGLDTQLLDRFGMCVDVSAEQELENLVEILSRRMAYDRSPSDFVASYAEAEAELAARLARTRSAVGQVEIPAAIRNHIAQLAAQANVSGHRTDLAMSAAAAAHAAWMDHQAVSIEDVEAVAELALVHRRRDVTEPPSDGPPPQTLQQNSDDSQRSREPNQHEPSDPSAIDEQPPAAPEDGSEMVAEIGETFAVRRLAGAKDRVARAGGGRRQLTLSSDARGHQVSSRPTSQPFDLALDATLRAAAPYQRSRRAIAASSGDDRANLAILVDPNDWRRKVRVRRTGSYVVLVVDASGSMGARNRMVASKGAVLSLLLDAYVKRDQVALISFRSRGAEVLVPPTSSVGLAQRRLRELAVGGRTPLASGLAEARALVTPLLMKEPQARPLVIVVTDGRANVGLSGEPSREAGREAIAVARKASDDPRIGWVVVDTEPSGVMARGNGAELAEALGASRFTIDDLHADDLVDVVHSAQSTHMFQAPRKDPR